MMADLFSHHDFDRPAEPTIDGVEVMKQTNRESTAGG
jgi:hypothetical protein